MTGRLLMICIVGAALCAAAPVRKTMFQEGDAGIVDVASRECGSVLWTSEVMWLSAVPSFRLTKIHVGDTMFVPDNCKAEKPSEKVQQDTLLLFKDIKAFQKQETAMSTLEDKKEETEVADEEKQGQSPGADNNNLQDKNKHLGEVNGKLHLLLKGADQSVISSMFWGIGLGCLFGATAVLAYFWFSFIPHLEKENQIDKEEAVDALNERLKTANEEIEKLRPKPKQPFVYYGEVVEWRDTTIRRVGCVYCFEDNIADNPKNKHDHLDKHTKLRIPTISQAEMRKKLAACNDN
ncbi:hypothetical protein HY311_00550 [Candidatus Nomurabacteria bacterium]|nr:hypothetical protein [Candidatus Nomurabacteria bacterium]